ncbi:hypothetical protein GHT06_004575 [Daphnia sinensis]|uniref:SWIM-type domain-containing protein n=1 Tax=Daphnia sinensis TaxID=1820382 RepID=A0AAD5KWE0_9CRUS|nr:hypothetical protein GHT06_006224 [Daphnia sinensis]KAI9550895.1 hypothetical protein GHT06_004575 [Daphnia sinensis]
MANDCPVQIQFLYDDALKKFKITKLEIEHKNHPVSEGHLKTYARKKQLDGTYSTTQSGFALYHILIEYNNGDSKPVAFFFIKKETIEAISACLKVLTDNHDTSVTKVTITDKDCAEIAALEKYFPDYTHILCQFHALKAVDAFLTKTKNGASVKEKYHDIRKHFRAAMYTESQDEFDSSKAYLTGKSKQLFHLENLFEFTNYSILTLDRQLKFNIRELRFSTKSKPELIKKYAESISPFGSMTYNIASHHTTYHLKKDLSCCTCHFFAAYGLPCRHIISFHFKDNIEIPVGSYSQHWRNECLEDEAVIQANVSSPTAVQVKKKLRMPRTEKDQFNLATNLFRKLAETLSALTINDFQEKMRLFHQIHALIKADKPIQLMQSIPQQEKTEEVSSWASLHLPVAPKKRGRPKENKGYFNTYHNQKKRHHTERIDRDDSLDEEAAIVNEEAQAIAKEEEMREIETQITAAFSVADSPVDNFCQMEAPIDTASFADNTTVEILSPTVTTGRTKSDRSAQPYLFLDKCQVITKTNKLMSGIGGLFCCTIGASLEFPQAQGDKWMQIVHDGKDHWVLIAKGFSQPEHVLVYDSLPSNPWYNNHILSCISSLLKSANKEMTYIVKTCQRQSNGYDCGVFAIAFAASLSSNGEDPTTRLYDPKKLRSHLIECFSSGKLSKFPSTPSRSTRSLQNETIGVEELFCNCHRTGFKLNSSEWEFIGCDRKDWWLVSQNVFEILS